MADNIKIIGNVNSVERISRINSVDADLLSSLNIQQVFNYNEDYIEYYVYDINNVLINTNYSYNSFKLPTDSYINPDGTIPSIEINPIQDLQDLGYVTGNFFTKYNFFKRKISNPNAEIFISEISEDRTEIRIDSTIISSSELISSAQSLINELDSSDYQKYFLLNFSNNQQQIIVNVGIDNTTTTPTILFKLYEPLPETINIKASCWVVEEIIEPYSFDLNLDILLPKLESAKLKGPNFNIELDIKQNIPTGYENYNSLVSYLTGSSYSKILNYLQDNSYDLNIDYTSFDNFIHFSSAKKRLEIFKYKIDQINDYNSSIENIISGSSGLKTAETSSFQTKIDNIISNFDGFENYLYFESSSYAWPKSNSVKPYVNKFYNKTFYQPSSSTTWTFSHSLNEIPVVKSIFNSSGSTLATQSSTITNNTISLTFSNSYTGYVILNSPSTSLWFSNYTSSAINYDNENLDHLYNTIPTYVKNDPDNYQSYYDFVDMIGHYFDNIWIYITSINELYNADNNLEKGISKDLVYDQLKSLGVKLYNSKGDDNFDHYINGLNSGSILFDNDFSSTSSFLNNIPKKDLLAETYKRIYHNIPLLSKTRGTKTGLQNLITTFGITGSILQPKEFGGSNKNNLINGYDNDKITIQNNTITGSVLSPYISLQTTPTASTEFTSTDLHFVDISFSPQNELNNRISASIALNDPSFNIDQYIGDPGLAESSSYDALITKKEYFISASSAVSGGAKPLDYNGFIQLIKNFDNSLFKMLKDFVPARTNVLTGVTIKSPILERNKIPQYKPKVSEDNNFEADYLTANISEDNEYLYDKLGGDKSSFYTGEIDGTNIDVYEYFENSNPNVYLHPTFSINQVDFDHSEFNVILNNVSSSIISNNRYKLEKLYTNVNNKVYNTSQEISSSAELQDSNLSLLSHVNSRYDGSKTTSLKYNIYSPSSSTYNGDKSFGQTAAIDHNTKKIGLFTQIQQSKFFEYPKRNNIALTYLVDENGNLTELNKRNYNLFEVQNTFKAGNYSVISLFDNQKYSDQRTTDGSKKIYNSGYEYHPSLYFSGSGDTYLYFNYIGEGNSRQFKINNNGGYLSGSNTITYPISNGNIYGLFNPSNDTFDSSYNLGNSYLSNNGANTFPTYSIQEKGNQRFISKFNINVKFGASNQSGSFVFKINKVGGNVLASQAQLANSGYNTTQIDNTSNPFNYARKTGTRIVTLGQVSVYNGLNEKIGTIAGGTYLYKIEASSEVTADCNLVTPKFYYVKKSYYDTILTVSCSDIFTLPSSSKEIYTLPEYALEHDLEFSVITDYNSFNVGDQVGFELSATNFSTNNFTASITPFNNESNNGTLYSELDLYQVGNLPTVVNTSYPFVSGSTNSNTIFFSKDLSYYYNYKFLPSGSGVIKNSLYDKYGYVDNVFAPKVGDVVIINYGSDNNHFESEIKNVYLTSNRLLVELNETLPGTLNIRKYSNSTINSFLLLSRLESENNIISIFDKNPGNTSLGLLIPDDIHPSILKNIDTITKELKTKLVDAGNLGDAGSF